MKHLFNIRIDLPRFLGSELTVDIKFVGPLAQRNKNGPTGPEVLDYNYYTEFVIMNETCFGESQSLSNPGHCLVSSL